MRPHVVRQGEYLTRLAATHGFVADEVWNHADNEALRGRRPNPEMLAPGDILQIPDAPAPPLDLTAESSNRFQARVPRVRVRVQMRSEGEPIAGERFVVEGVGTAPITGESDGDGFVSFEVPVTTRQCVLRLPARGAVYPILVGHLDPPEERSGARARLEHLGMLGPDLRSTLEQGMLGAEAHRDTVPLGPADAFDEAIRAFQIRSGISPTGTADAATLAALRTAHDGEEG